MLERKRLLRSMDVVQEHGGVWGGGEEMGENVDESRNG